MATNKVYQLNSAATTNAAVIKAGTGVVFSVAVFGSTTTLHTVKLYDQLASPTVGTDRPTIAFSSGVVAGQSTIYDFGPGGARFNNGIGISVGGGATSPVDTDTGVATVNAVKVVVNYK